MKKIFCLILAFALCVSLCACGVDERYTVLIECLDNHDYEGAAMEVMALRQQAIDNGDIVIVEPQEEDHDLVNRYGNIARNLMDYDPDDYFSVWNQETEESYEDNAALDYSYTQLQAMEGVDEWLGSEYFSYLEEEGIPTDRLALLDRFTIVENQLLYTTSKTVDNMGNENENEYGAWFYDENGTLIKSYESWDSVHAGWEGLYNASGYYRYTYNDAGVITETKVTNRENTSVDAVIVPAYDDAGNLISETITDNNGTNVFHYSYDANGNLIQMEYSDEWNDNTVFYTYDEQGRLTQKERCLNNSINFGGEDLSYVEARKTTVNTYDASGNLVSAVITYVNYNWNYNSGELTTEEYSKKVDTVSYSYDAEGRLAQEVWQYGNEEYSDGDINVSQYASRTIDYTYGNFYIFQ